METIDQTDLYECPDCGEKELAFSQYTEGTYCQICGKYVEAKPDMENHGSYFESLGEEG